MKVKVVKRTIPRGYVFTCGYCGKPFQPSRLQIASFERNQNIYCSDDCRIRGNLANNRARSEENGKIRKDAGIFGLSKTEIEKLKLRGKVKNDLILEGINDYG